MAPNLANPPNPEIYLDVPKDPPEQANSQHFSPIANRQQFPNDTYIKGPTSPATTLPLRKANHYLNKNSVFPCSKQPAVAFTKRNDPPRRITNEWLEVSPHATSSNPQTNGPFTKCREKGFSPKRTPNCFEISLICSCFVKPKLMMIC